MPPQVKVPKEAIVDKAFELTREYGFEKVTARMLAGELNCSTQPIFHVFKNMDELRTEVYEKTVRFFEKYVLKKPKDNSTPYYLNMGLRYIEFAQKEKNLFRLLSMSDSGTRLKSFYDLTNNIPVPIEPEVFVKTWIFTHGIATLVSTNTTKISQREIKEMITEAGTSFDMYSKKKK